MIETENFFSPYHVIYIYICIYRERERESTYKHEMLDSLRLMLDECSVSMRGFLFHGSMPQMECTHLV